MNKAVYKLRVWLIDAKKSQTEIATKELGISRQFFSNMIREQCPIPQKYWRKIIELTDHAIRIDDFLDEK